MDTTCKHFIPAQGWPPVWTLICHTCGVQCRLAKPLLFPLGSKPSHSSHIIACHLTPQTVVSSTEVSVGVKRLPRSYWIQIWESHCMILWCGLQIDLHLKMKEGRIGENIDRAVLVAWMVWGLQFPLIGVIINLLYLLLHFWLYPPNEMTFLSSLQLGRYFFGLNHLS